MVEAAQQQQSDEAQSQQLAYEWTMRLVTNVENRMREVISADELKKLTIENAMPEFKKVLQQFVCPICTNVLEEFACCNDCEGLICRSCLNQWLARDTVCPLCKQGFEEMKVSDIHFQIY